MDLINQFSGYKEKIAELKSQAKDKVEELKDKAEDLKDKAEDLKDKAEELKDKAAAKKGIFANFADSLRDLESGTKESENEERVNKAVQDIIRREVSEGDARVVYIRKAPKQEEGRMYTLVCCMVIILTLLIVIMVLKFVKGV